MLEVALGRGGARRSKISKTSRRSSHRFAAIAADAVSVVIIIVWVVVMVVARVAVSVMVLQTNVSGPTLPHGEKTDLVDGVTVTLKRLSQSGILDCDGAWFTAVLRSAWSSPLPIRNLCAHLPSKHLSFVHLADFTPLSRATITTASPGKRISQTFSSSVHGAYHEGSDVANDGIDIWRWGSTPHFKAQRQIKET